MESRDVNNVVLYNIQCTDCIVYTTNCNDIYNNIHKLIKQTSTSLHTQSGPVICIICIIIIIVYVNIYVVVYTWD